MPFNFKKNIHQMVFLLAAFFYSCHSLPPSTPAGPEQESFQPGVGLWEETSMPVDLLGDWYKGGRLELTVAEDTLRVGGVWSLIRSVEKSGSYYRIIHVVGIQYYATYFLDLTEESVEVVEAKGYAEDEAGAAALSEIESRHTMTSTNPWVAAGMPGDLQGNWHIHDGKMEIIIEKESAVIEGEIWDIAAVETNRTVDRLILRIGDRYNSLYFADIGEYTMEALLVDGKEDIQDRYGKVPGDWVTLYRWWDFIETCRLYPGSSWIYEYSYQHYYDQVYDTSTPIDSIVQINSLKGLMNLEVTSNTISGGVGSIILQATFQIEEEKGRYYHVKKNGGTQVLTDSSWSNLGGTKTVQHEVFLENDTLWFETGEGKVIFASNKLQPDAMLNLRAFVYPFEFPKDGFPEGRDIIRKIALPDHKTHAKYWEGYGGGHYITFTTTEDGELKRHYVLGLFLTSYACFTFGYGFNSVHYSFGDYDQRIRYGYGEYHNPYIKETSFYCKLLEFSPGY